LYTFKKKFSQISPPAFDSGWPSPKHISVLLWPNPMAADPGKASAAMAARAARNNKI
jgi:hypothetical protein